MESGALSLVESISLCIVYNHALQFVMYKVLRYIQRNSNLGSESYHHRFYYRESTKAICSDLDIEGLIQLLEHRRKIG
jgi:hypothetical protein